MRTPRWTMFRVPGTFQDRQAKPQLDVQNIWPLNQKLMGLEMATVRWFPSLQGALGSIPNTA